MKAATFAVLVLLAGFGSQGGRATVTYQPTPLEGQGCPSDEDIAQVIENFHSLIEDRVETESSPETQLLTELSTAVETLRQEVAELSNNSTVETLRQEVAELSNNSAVETLRQEVAELLNNSAVETLRQEVAELSNNSAVETLRQEVAELSNNSQAVNRSLTELIEDQAERLTALETESSSETELLTELSTAVETIFQTISRLNQALPATSCQQIFENRPDLPSEHYWIRSSNGTAVQVYCDMARQCCNETTGGWTRVANLNMTDPSQQCPPAWTLITSPRRSCGRTSTGSFSCDSVNFPTNGITYSRVCGRIKAYQIGTPDAFGDFNSHGQTTIDSVFVEGVSITHGSSPRQHVWTFAAAWHEQYTGRVPFTCPCTNVNSGYAANIPIPPFIGNDYFCETAAITPPPSGTLFFPDDPLWDGEGCGPTSTCCEFNNPPWFCKQLPAPTSDDIEARLCFREVITNENVAVEQIELYVS